MAEWSDILVDISKESAPPETNTSGLNQKKPDPISYPGIPTPVNLAKNLELHLENVNILLPDHKNTSIAGHSDSLHLNLQVTPEKGGYTIEFQLITGAGTKREGQVQGHGEWTASSNRELHFTFAKIPAGFLYRILYNKELRQNILPEPDISISAGRMQGSGSATIDASGKGLGINLKGNYSDLSFQIPNRNPLLILNKGKGSFSFNTGIYADRVEPAFIQFNIEQKDFHINSLYRNIPDLDPAKNGLDIKGDIHIQNGPSKNKSGVFSYLDNVTGDVEYNIYIPHPLIHTQINPRIDINLRNIVFDISNYTIRSKKTAKDDDIADAIDISSGTINIKSNGLLHIKTTGRFFQAPVETRGTGRVEFKTPVNRITGEKSLDIIHNTSLESKLIGVSYSDLASLAVTMTEQIIDAGYSPDARSTEDGGPVWYNKFTDTDIYTKVIRNMTLDWRFFFQQMKQAGSLPDSVVVHLRKSGPLARVETISSDPDLSVKYTLGFEGFLPRHEFRFRINWDTPYLAQEKSSDLIPVPSELNVEYRYNGEGYLPGDLIHRSYSNLIFNGKKIDLSRTEPGKIALYGTRINDSNLKLDELRFQRLTDGASTLIQGVKMSSPDFTAFGNGKYDTTEGGNVQMFYKLGKDSPVSDSIKYRVKKDGTWIPITEF